VRVLIVDSISPSFEVISDAVEVLKRGEVIIYPTDTVYGVGVNALDPRAVTKIFKIKERPLNQALPVAISGLDMAKKFAIITKKAEKLMEAFWPGALTIILRRKPEIPEVVTGDRSKVGLRAPNHIVPLSITKTLNLPIIATSANKHGNVDPVDADEALNQLGDEVDLIIDGGRVSGKPSTVIDMLRKPPLIVRRGTITEAMIEEIIGRVEVI
jgi:L-threonylcarbamoyladenylate synthase